MDTLALAPGQFNNLPPLSTNTVASTNPVKNVSSNVLTQGQSYMGGIVNFDTATGQKLAVGGTTLAKPVATQSTTTLSSDKTNDILGAKTQLGALSQKGVTTNPDGISTLANGSVYTPPEPEKTTALSLYDSSAQDAEISSNLDAMQAITDAQTATTIQNIKDKYTRLREEQKKANDSTLAGTKSALLSSGAMQHDVFSNDAITQRINQNTKSLLDLEQEENDLIAAANAAAMTGKYKILEAKNKEISDKREQKTKLAEQINKEILDANKEAQKKNETIQSENAISTLYNQGVTDPNQIAQKMRAAGYTTPLKDITDNVALLSGQGGTGIVGEYNFYKSEAAKKGQVPMGFNEYQNVDANRKIKIANAANAAGLNTQTMNTALKLSDDYEQRSKSYYDQREAYNRIISSATDPSAAGDLALIFNYMKVLDPGSTVREGEFANAQNAGSAWSTIGAKYNKVVNGERLTETQRKDFVDRATRLFTGAKKQQDVVVKEFTDRAKKYGVPADLVVRDTSATGSNTQDLIVSEDSAKKKVVELGNSDPKLKTTIGSILKDNPNITFVDLLTLLGK